MGYVLTYHELKNEEDWFLSDPYQRNQINAIKDPHGGNVHEAPTSIPSPFAHFDLVKTAFKNMVKNGEINPNASTIDFKLVSDALDVGELFFNIFAHKGHVKVVKWDAKEDLDRLLASGVKAHRRLGEALKLYLDQDAEAYNFDKLSALYLLQFDNDPERVVGGTSPSTLFFASPNPHTYAHITMPNGDVLFDQSYTHLHDRDSQFQLFLFALSAAYPDFGQRFREVNEYLNATRNKIAAENRDFYIELTNLTKDFYKDHFKEISISGTHEFAYVLDLVLRTRQDELTSSSDFEIRSHSTRFMAMEKKPLVLQHGHGGKSRHQEDLIYYSHPYPKGLPIPNRVREPLEERKLPGLEQIQHPFLVVSDLLEDYLIELFYPINKEKYFDGHLKDLPGGDTEDNRGFLLPIKPMLFDYFSPEELKGIVDDGKPMLEMERLATGVKVTLRIPIKKQGEYIKFERIYYKSSSTLPEHPDPDANRGVIFEAPFGVSIFPFIGMGNFEEERPYRVMLVDKDNLPNRDYSLRFIRSDSNQTVKPTAHVNRTAPGDNAHTKIYVLNREFDAIELDNGLAKGILIPNLVMHSIGSKEFHFSIDFGTTNTHLEYKEGASGTPRPFDITEGDLQVGTLHPLEEGSEYMRRMRVIDILKIPEDLFPERIGRDSNMSFPQRTVLAERHNIDFGQPTYTLADFNIPFIYGKRLIPGHSEIRTNLKWSNYTMDMDSKRRVRAFLEKLMFMIRAKVLLNRGHLKQTKITWFYPSNMTMARVDALEEMWNAVYNQYIGGQAPLGKLPESISPFYYYRNRMNITAASKPVVAIDIGGGTSDVVVFQHNRPSIITSFRFAANSIFGDAYSEYGAANTNGFVQRYYPQIQRLLSTNNLTDLEDVLNKLVEENKSIDVIAFFFSLEDNLEIRRRNLPISFTELLKNDDHIRLVFVLFFTAIMYHVAKLMKARELEKPRYITFSGNGSRVLQFISSSDERISNLAKTIFDEVYRDKGAEDSNLNVYREKDEPKEATCRGGLMMKETFSLEEIEDMTVAYLGLEDHPFSDDSTRYDTINREFQEELLQDYKGFYDFFFKLNDKLAFNKRFGVTADAVDIARSKMKEDVDDFLQEGLETRKKELPETNIRVEETLFFFPLIGVINRLAYSISQMD